VKGLDRTDATELESLRARLAEAEETIRAIRQGDVDALIVAGPDGDCVYTLKGAETPYRILVEQMQEGAVTTDAAGTILYSNRRFAGLMGQPLERVIGSSIRDAVIPADRAALERLLASAVRGTVRAEVTFAVGPGRAIPVYICAGPLPEAPETICLIATDLTEQKRSEEVLASEKLARSILDNAAEAVVVCDAGGRIIRASRIARELCAGDPAGRLFTEVFTAEPCRVALAAALDGRILRGVETRLATPAGPVYVILSAGPLAEAPDASGVPELPGGCVITLADVTGRKRAERELELRNAVAQVLARSSTLPDAAAGLLQAVCRLQDWVLGAVWEAPEGEGTLSLVSGWHRPGTAVMDFVELTRQSRFERGEGLPGRVWASGQPCWIPDVASDRNFPRGPVAARVGLHAAFAFPILMNDRVLGVMEFFSPEIREPEPRLLDLMTAVGSQIGQYMERLRAREALRRSEERYRRLVELSPDAVFVVAPPDGRIAYANAAVLRLFGATGREQIIGRVAEDLIHPDSRPAAGDRTRRMGVTDRHHDPAEEKWVRLDGSVVQVEAVAASLPWGVAGDSALQVVARDITERKKAEAELGRHRDELAQLVAERTGELERSHQRLRLAERMAAVGTLSTGLGHDMGNLLLPVRARLDALGAMDMPEAVREHHKAIGQCAEYLLSLARGLRLFAQDPVDGAAAGTAVTDLEAWRKDAAPFFRNLVPKSMALEWVMPPGLPRVGLPPHQLTQAMLNLVNNARDALTGQGGCGAARTDAPVRSCAPGPSAGRVTISARADAGRIRLSVADNGPGMSEDVKARCLEPFFTTKTRSISTGMGLSLVHALAQGVGGSVHIDTVPGRGTTIALVLPAVLPPEDAGPAPSAAVSLRDARLGSLTRSLLDRMGFRVQRVDGPGPPEADLWVTEDSPEALRLARRFLSADASRRVLVMGVASAGEGTSGHDETDWKALGAVVLARGASPSELRTAIDRAAAGVAV
jgi:PAS domain S-box-containing protein